MARYIESDCKVCRRAGEKLFLKGLRCSTPKCALERRNYAPGERHARFRSKLSDYAQRLREKQKVKAMYGLLERQFRRYFAMAERQKGTTGLNLLRLLETRLDNVVFRLGLAASRDQARQLVRHGHIRVNSRRVNIPSFNVKLGQVIEISPQAKEYKIFKENLETTKERVRPTWLEFDEKNLTGKVSRLPVRDDITTPIQENLIVELYSR